MQFSTARRCCVPAETSPPAVWGVVKLKWHRQEAPNPDVEYAGAYEKCKLCDTERCLELDSDDRCWVRPRTLWDRWMIADGDGEALSSG